MEELEDRHTLGEEERIEKDEQDEHKTFDHIIPVVIELNWIDYDNIFILNASEPETKKT